MVSMQMCFGQDSGGLKGDENSGTVYQLLKGVCSHLVEVFLKWDLSLPGVQPPKGGVVNNWATYKGESIQ